MDATLLLCDDESLSRDMLERFFSQCGFHVETARNEWECIEKVKTLHPDVLVAGFETLDCDASAVTWLLHESYLGSEMPAVLIVGNLGPRVLSRRTGVPESFCLQRPLWMEGLLDRVGLAFAQIDLRRNQQRPFHDPRIVHSEEAETCLA